MKSLRRFPMLLACSILFSMAAAQAQDTTESEIKPANLTFTTIDVPGAMATVVLGINTAGEMVGYFYDSGNGSTATGFLYNTGAFTFFSYPGADATRGTGINDLGLISGTAYMNQNTSAVGFTYDGTTFTAIQRSNQVFTEVNGINNAGDIAGGFGDLGANTAFELIAGRFRNTTPPPGGWINASATGVNNLGAIVGSTTSASTNGFLFKSGRFETISFPGATETDVWGINDGGLIVGNHPTTDGFAGFAMARGKYKSIAYPKALYTFAFGVNNAGQVVGAYTFDGQVYHGFVSSPVAN